MRKTMSKKTGDRPCLRRLVLWLTAGLCLAATATHAAPAEDAAAGSPAPDLSSILGPGSQLRTAKDGEFTLSFGDTGELDNFRAIKDVIVITEDINCLCDELIYHGAQGHLTATTKPGKLVKITLRNMAAGSAGGGKKGDTRATCRRYQFFIKEQRHELTLDPIIYRKDANNKETAISGDHITLTQDKAGRWKMVVKGHPQIYDPKKKGELDKAVQDLKKKPVMTFDSDPLKQNPNPAPTASGTGTGGPAGSAPKAVRIDPGNVQKLKPVKSSKIVKLEEGG